MEIEGTLKYHNPYGTTTKGDIKIPIFIIISSSGPAIEEKGNCLGEYQYNLNLGHFEQTSDLGRKNILYRHTDNKWYVANNKGKNTCTAKSLLKPCQLQDGLLKIV